MQLPPIELDLPFDEPRPRPQPQTPAQPQDDEVRRRRRGHLMEVPGMDEATAARLLTSFPTLGAVYAASEERLREVVGSVAAARIRWFLDAPLGLSTRPARRPPWRSAA
jgi:ERCC4-type nuclease